MFSWKEYIENGIGTAEYLRDVVSSIGSLENVSYTRGSVLSITGHRGSIIIALNGEEAEKPERVSLAIEMASEMCPRYPLMKRSNI